ncbi:hypothetical protein Acr_20g0012070 [Actinidia rufa]|uniref:Uncharacterized protein n=1 Tax=Actinidia rufa TaxID=165716 RepID=A0A7J0GF36_9ERIC|nr:hypothetical protein Acr_20g0012070 [Actinidia rufa]
MKSEMSPARRIVQIWWKSIEAATGASLGHKHLETWKGRAEGDFWVHWKGELCRGKQEVAKLKVEQYEPLTPTTAQALSQGVQAVSDWVSRKWRILASVAVRELNAAFSLFIFPLDNEASRFMQNKEWNFEEPWITHPLVELSSVPGHRLWSSTLPTIGDRCGGFIERLSTDQSASVHGEDGSRTHGFQSRLVSVGGIRDLRWSQVFCDLLVTGPASLSCGLNKGRSFSCSYSGFLPRILDGGGASVEGCWGWTIEGMEGLVENGGRGIYLKVVNGLEKHAAALMPDDVRDSLVTVDGEDKENASDIVEEKVEVQTDSFAASCFIKNADDDFTRFLSGMYGPLNVMGMEKLWEGPLM